MFPTYLKVKMIMPGWNLEWVRVPHSFRLKFSVVCAEFAYLVSISANVNVCLCRVRYEHGAYFWSVPTTVYAYAQTHPLGFALMEWLYYVNIMILIIFSRFFSIMKHIALKHTFNLHAQQLSSMLNNALLIEPSSVFRYSTASYSFVCICDGIKTTMQKGNEIIFGCIPAAIWREKNGEEKERDRIRYSVLIFTVQRYR